MRHSDVVIIGGGPAGRVVVHSLRDSARGLSVTLVKDETVNVNRCAVPYGVTGEQPIESYLIPNTLVSDFGAELVLDRVSRIDVPSSTVELADGDELHYDHLVIATGSRPIVPPIPGIERPNITAVRSQDDLRTLRDLAATHKRALVVGGGYIGVEVAVVLRRMGLEVSIVEMQPHVMEAGVEPEFLALVEEDLESRGIELVTGARVVSFDGPDEACREVVLDDGRRIETDFVVLSIGVRPNVELAEAAGIQTSRYGIVTDEGLRTSAPQVYAAGDCAEKKSFLTGGPLAGEFGTNAVFMGRVVADNILGLDAVFSGVINANATTTFTYSLGGAGLSQRAAEAAGMEVVVGTSEVLDRYPMMEHAAALRTKLVFDADSLRLLGGSVVRQSDGVAANVDFLSLAIQKESTLDDLLRLQYATHPELAAKPSDNMFYFAAKDALRRAGVRSPG